MVNNRNVNIRQIAWFNWLSVVFLLFMGIGCATWSMRKSQEAVTRGNFSEAEQRLRKVVQAKPDNYKAHEDLAEVYMKIAQREKYRDIDKAIGYLKDAVGQYEEVIMCLKQSARSGYSKDKITLVQKKIDETGYVIEDFYYLRIKDVRSANEYIDIYRNGRYVEQARIKEDDFIWGIVKSRNTIEGYLNYLRWKHTGGRHKDECQRSLEKLEFEAAEDIGTIESYQKFITKYPDSSEVAYARQLIDFYIEDQRVYGSSEAVENFESYLDKFIYNSVKVINGRTRYGRFRKEALSHLQQLLLLEGENYQTTSIDKTQVIEKWKRFLDRFSNEDEFANNEICKRVRAKIYELECLEAYDIIVNSQYRCIELWEWYIGNFKEELVKEYYKKWDVVVSFDIVLLTRVQIDISKIRAMADDRFNEAVNFYSRGKNSVLSSSRRNAYLKAFDLASSAWNLDHCQKYELLLDQIYSDFRQSFWTKHVGNRILLKAVQEFATYVLIKVLTYEPKVRMIRAAASVLLP